MICTSYWLFGIKQSGLRFDGDYPKMKEIDEHTRTWQEENRD